MNDTDTQNERRWARVLLVSHDDTGLTDAVEMDLEAAGYALSHQVTTDESLAAIVFLPGGDRGGLDASTVLTELVTTRPDRLLPRSAGGTRVVTVVSSEWLGTGADPRAAAQSAALVATTRSLALAHAPQGVTANCVVALPDPSTTPGDDRHALGSHVVEVADVARAVRFFVDPRSSYITGQTFHCTGGSTLLSSMSV